MWDAGILVPIALFVCGAATAIFVPVTRAYARRMDRESSSSGASHDLTMPVELIGQAKVAIDSEEVPY
jgi:hypothetical protein